MRANIDDAMVCNININIDLIFEWICAFDDNFMVYRAKSFSDRSLDCDSFLFIYLNIQMMSIRNDHLPSIILIFIMKSSI